MSHSYRHGALGKCGIGLQVIGLLLLIAGTLMLGRAVALELQEAQ